MRVNMIVESIIKKYSLQANVPNQCATVYSTECRELLKIDGNWYLKTPDSMLRQLYAQHISKGHYGFAIGAPTPKSWVLCLIEILNRLIELDPHHFEIQQIKTRYGEIIFKVSSQRFTDIDRVQKTITTAMSEKKLIY